MSTVDDILEKASEREERKSKYFRIVSQHAAGNISDYEFERAVSDLDYEAWKSGEEKPSEHWNRVWEQLRKKKLDSL